MQEIKPTATETSIYHTRMSCITQTNAAGKQLVRINRFSCSAICPQDSQHGLVIADSVLDHGLVRGLGRVQLDLDVFEQRQPRVWPARRWLCPASCSDSTAVMHCTSKCCFNSGREEDKS
ncbi:hypothetical protein PR001_g25727 [Phytophthora rubi]|uniref:Uncharacterized protein n=1 Tax=Phytophthora rubi TaxID=129364 RepID=A0A6A3I4X8_9STRA|nr:hypothetical protein PR001_g25727 [Phytophthora rubi]